MPTGPSPRGFVLALALAGSSLGLVACGDAGADRPNLLLISVDSLRRDHVSAYGHRSRFAPQERTTPAVEALAAAGVLFDDAVTTTSWTLPSHMALMTGLPDRLHGVTNNDVTLDPAIATLATVLEERGYATGGFYSGPNLHPYYGFGRGFDVYENASGKALPEDAFAAEDRDDLLGVHRESHAGRTSASVLASSVAWLEQAAAGDEPFFLFVHWWDPHYDYEPPAEYVRRFDPGYRGRANGRNFVDSRELKDSRDMQHIQALYDAEIRFTDDHIARLIARLDDLGLAEDTLVVFVADHGDEFYDHGKKGHQRNFFDESVRIPLVMRMPGRIPAGSVVRPQVRMQDILPTVCEVLDVPAPVWTEGVSLVPLWEDPATDLRPPAQFLELELPRRDLHLVGARRQDFKVVWDLGEGRGEVYDLQADPLEQSPRVFTSLEDEDPAVRFLRARLEQLVTEGAAIPRTPGHDGVTELPTDLLDALEFHGYLGDGDEDEEP